MILWGDPARYSGAVPEEHEQTGAENPEPSGGTGEGARWTLFDPGWLFIVAGLGLLSAVVLIPAQAERDEARWLRDRALAMEAHRKARLDRHEAFLKAVDEQQPALVMSLAAAQLNQIPADRSPVGGVPEQGRTSASVFPALEPPALTTPERTSPNSRLYRWSMGERSRLWLIAGGALLVMVGLLPASRRR